MGTVPSRAACVAFVLGGLALFVFALVAAGREESLTDERFLAAVNGAGGRAGPAMDASARLLMPLGLAVAVVGLATFLIVKEKGIKPVLWLAIAAGLGWLFANGAKLLVDRPRPYLVLEEIVLRQDPARGTSFPSSHVAIAVAVLIAATPFGSRTAIIIGTIYVVAVAWSRMYVGVHYPVDVLGGIGAGMVAGGLALLLLRTFGSG
jgi:membrane-associated phospholipid phosphatase